LRNVRLMLKHHIIQFLLYYICQVVVYGRLKTKENFKLLALKVVAVAYERWSLTRGSKFSDWLGNFWYFGKRWGEVVTTGGSTVCRQKKSIILDNKVAQKSCDGRLYHVRCTKYIKIAFKLKQLWIWYFRKIEEHATCRCFHMTSRQPYWCP